MSIEKRVFINSDGLTRLVKYFLFAQILIAVLSMISSYLEYQLLADFQLGIYDTEEQAHKDAAISDYRQRILAIVYLVNAIASGIVILKWIYRANYNSHRLGARYMKFTSGWSIGYYFIPILTLWKPYQAMKEIWQTSEHPKNWKSVHASKVLPLWWTVWIINNYLGRATAGMITRAKEVNAYMQANLMEQASCMLDIVLALAFLYIVIRVNENQNKAYAASLIIDESAMPVTVIDEPVSVQPIV